MDSAGRAQFIIQSRYFTVRFPFLFLSLSVWPQKNVGELKCCVIIRLGLLRRRSVESKRREGSQSGKFAADRVALAVH